MMDLEQVDVLDFAMWQLGWDDTPEALWGALEMEWDYAWTTRDPAEVFMEKINVRQAEADVDGVVCFFGTLVLA